MKRDIFAELLEGFETLADGRRGKVTLRSHPARLEKLSPLDATELVHIREQLNTSPRAFATYLRLQSPHFFTLFPTIPM